MTKNGSTEIKHTIFTTDKETQYDKNAKQILGQKQILAHILVYTVEEFKGMKPEEVIPYIEGEPYIGIVPVNPGHTNASSKKNGKIYGLNTENMELNEGEICFDVFFYVRTRDGLSKIIIDIEAQKDEPFGYDIMNRAVFYVSREISAQKNREFVKSEYDNIKQVYTIWLCMNQKENTMEWYHLTGESIIGNQKWKGRVDQLNIIMIGLAENPPEEQEGKKLHRLLGVLFSQHMNVEEKSRILKEEYKISMEEGVGKDVEAMCNLGQGIKEAGIREGIEIGRREERKYTEREKRRADELERRNAWLTELLAAHGIQV